MNNGKKTLYQMILGNEVKKLPKSDFVFTPIDGKQLRERLEKI